MNHADPHEAMRKKKLTFMQKVELASALRQNLFDNIDNGGNGFAYGFLKKMEQQFNLSRKTVYKISSQIKADPFMSFDVLKPATHRCGRKKKNRENIKQQIQHATRTSRQTARSTAAVAGVSPMTIYRMLKEKELRRHRSSLKPSLTHANKVRRFAFALESLNENFDCFNPMNLDIHVDEKWFYMTQASATYYLVEGEAPPGRNIKNARRIPKIMFLCAVARPRVNPDGSFFDGKIGMWAFVEETVALRNSANRPAGTVIWKAKNVNAEEYRRTVVENLIPAVVEKFPGVGNVRVRIQQDNAPVHRLRDMQELEEMTQEALGISVEFVYQPPNSPDTNVLDLGIFRSLQALQFQRVSNNEREIIDNVQEVFNAYEGTKINKAFLSLQANLEKIIEVNGGNNYILAHMGKDRLANTGQLPHVVTQKEENKKTRSWTLSLFTAEIFML